MSTLFVDSIQPQSNAQLSISSLSSGSLPTGSVLQVKTATTGYVTQTINSTTPVLIEGLEVTLTPRDANSIILVQATIPGNWTYVSSVFIYKDGVTAIPDHSGDGLNQATSGNTALWTRYNSLETTANTNQLKPMSVTYYDTAGTANSVTYSIRAMAGWSGAATVTIINNRPSLDMLSQSIMTVMEIAG